MRETDVQIIKKDTLGNAESRGEHPTKEEERHSEGWRNDSGYIIKDFIS